MPEILTYNYESLARAFETKNDESLQITQVTSIYAYMA